MNSFNCLWPYVDWNPDLTYNPGFSWSYTTTLALLPHGIEISAVCDHCKKKESIPSAIIPASWIKLNDGADKVFCSHDCVAKYAKVAK